MSLSPKVQAWIETLRPKTLPLAISAMLVGSALGVFYERFSWLVMLLAILTATFLQILSNLSNDYGDAAKGTDNDARLGPIRGMQQGVISLKQMQRAIVWCVLFAVISGLGLLYVACNSWVDVGKFILLGLFSILAAIGYTMGKKPYGYLGLGDLAVLIFFGWLAVMGSFYLQSLIFNPFVLLPATGTGLLAIVVLNINNLRDIENDTVSGKKTLIVRIGASKGRYYHAFLLFGAMICFFLFSLVEVKSIWGWLFLLTSPLCIKHAKDVLQAEDGAAIRPLLGGAVKCALLTNLLFAVSISLLA